MSKAKIVKVEGPFTEWYAPTYAEPYNDNEEYAAYYDTAILAKQPVIGPAVDGDSEYLSGDLECLADRMTCDCDMNEWGKARYEFEKAVSKALATGKAQTFKFKNLEKITITPYKEVPQIPEKAYEVYGEYGWLVKDRVGNI